MSAITAIDEKFTVTSSPHIFSDNDTRRIMLDVLIALIPAALAGAWFFGIRSLFVTVVTASACIITELICRKVMKRGNTIGDLSAAVTGVLLALNLPPSVELWKAVVGGAAAIVIGKQIFGGIGHNFMNPALLGRVIMLTSWGASMTRWTPAVSGALFGGVQTAAFAGADAVSAATPLALVKELAGSGLGAGVGASSVSLPSYADMFLGNIAGCIGETSALAILIGGAYLLFRGVIRWHIPVVYTGTAAVLIWVFGGVNGLFSGDPLFHVLGGGLLLGAFFMATDYTTSPMTTKGKVIMGVGCGVLTAVIRLLTPSPEGVSYSILIMNVVVPLIDRYTVPRVFGALKVSSGKTKGGTGNG